MAEGSDAVETADLIDREPMERWKAAAAIAPFLFLGFAAVVMLLLWGLNGLWAFMILPPILFISVLGWLAFRNGFVRDLGEAREAGTADDDR